ncbi:NAD-binding protein [Streptomyces alanosinicus]|uniref:3-hydroxyisobutyrate dehydrogenase-like NAD-binding domain-containing protein n=1 Tax=Streptomyces alanosinicus TaxID=68171 RepID=A0A918YKF7_9ACTN|nr:NAD-binding protein [Streptomyces alanosinicus]GHE06217.1 hypothetical protein GCM10010339_45460 [Streptomyces alanosinicus]
MWEDPQVHGGRNPGREGTSPPSDPSSPASPCTALRPKAFSSVVLADGDYDDSFAMALACKDLGLAVDLGRDLGVSTELSALVEQVYRRAKAQHGALAGEMSPVRLYEALAGREFRLPPPTATLDAAPVTV